MQFSNEETDAGSNPAGGAKGLKDAVGDTFRAAQFFLEQTEIFIYTLIVFVGECFILCYGAAFIRGLPFYTLHTTS